jgi:hypothetical protein
LSSRAKENHSFANRSLQSRDLGCLNREGHDFSRAEQSQEEDAALATEGSEAKFAAIGIHISRFVTSHGFALKVNTDFSYFDLIILCGITARPVTSMQLGSLFSDGARDLARTGC